MDNLFPKCIKVLKYSFRSFDKNVYIIYTIDAILSRGKKLSFYTLTFTYIYKILCLYIHKQTHVSHTHTHTHAPCSFIYNIYIIYILSYVDTVKIIFGWECD